MSYFKYLRALGVAAGLTAAACTTNAQEIKKVFVIAMENHNWTQPANQFTGGDNFGVSSDADPYTGGTNQSTDQHFVPLLTKAGKTWKSYQEDIDLTKNAGGQLTNVVLPESEWFLPSTVFRECSHRERRTSGTDRTSTITR